MSRTFAIPGTNYSSQAVGGCTNVDSGAYTIICLFNVTAGNNSSGLISFRSSGGTMRAQLIVDGNQLFGANDFQGGQTGITTGTWRWAAIRFPGGTNKHYTYSLRTYNSGSTSHQTGTSNFSNSGATITEIRLGNGDDPGNASIAAWAVWTSSLSDAQVEGMFSTAAADILAQSPVALWLGNQANSTDHIDDSVGTSNWSSFTGTVGVGSDPPGYDYTLSSATNGTATATAAGTASALATVRSKGTPTGAGTAAGLGTLRVTVAPTGAGNATAAVTQRPIAASTGAGLVGAAVTLTTTAAAAGVGTVDSLATVGATAAATGAGTAAATVGQGATMTGVGTATAVPTLGSTATMVAAGVMTALVGGLASATATATGAGVMTALADPHHIYRPDSGKTLRPNSGVIARPDAGVVPRP